MSAGVSILTTPDGREGQPPERSGTASRCGKILSAVSGGQRCSGEDSKVSAARGIKSDYTLRAARDYAVGSTVNAKPACSNAGGIFLIAEWASSRV